MKSRMFTAKPLAVVFGAMLMVVLSLTFSSTVNAHGYVSQPESRGLLCKTGANIDCGGVQYEPQSLEAPGNFPIGGPADGHIAGANIFPKLDEQSKYRWTKVPMKSGANTFEWSLTAAHATTKWDYYITKKDWNPDQPLKRADLEPFCTINDGGKNPAFSVKHNCNVPDRSGYQVILAVWSIADTPNAFYNVIDANFDGTTVPPIDPGPVDPDPTPNPNPETDTWSSTQVYVGGNEVTYNGSVYKAKWWTQGEKPGDSAVWELVTDNGNVTPEPSANEWNTSKVYLGGHKVEYNGNHYQAKWWTQGEKPGSSAVWELVKSNGSVVPDDSTNEWSASKVYLSGDRVKYTSVLYQANWWTQGNSPDSSREWSIVN
ncbi:Chitin-binding protein [Sporosarcina sp. ANT_H38]|uniref:lytic polysaccharide monooxygenase n=1 Tax=Sporosarcina sp. ANT_H38 TaxID=2597358 RepID=UPI00165D8266